MAKYPDLKSFVNVNYIDVLSSEIQKFVDKNLDGNGFHSINVVSLIETAVFTAASTSHHNCTMFGLEARQASTRG